MPEAKIVLRLVADKVTKGAVRFTEQDSETPLSVYLRYEQVESLGKSLSVGQAITVEIVP